jgi:hypothetical protein
MRRRFVSLSGFFVTQNSRDLNSALCSVIDDTVVELLGSDVLASLYGILEKQHAITRDELPYRLESSYKVLEDAFEVFGAKTLGSVIAQKLYAGRNSVFCNHDGYTLSDYVEFAKSKLIES